MPVQYLTPSVEDRALEVLLLLADQGRHRAPAIPDLMIAAVAELASLIALHLDKDFELIADVTGQASSVCASALCAIESDPPRTTPANLNRMSQWHLNCQIGDRGVSRARTSPTTQSRPAIGSRRR